MVSVSTVSSSTIHVSWGEVPCPQRNGEITGYIVEYSRRGTKRQVGGEQIHVNNRTTTINELDPLTEYIIRVAAVNSNGTGPFSDPVMATTNEARMSITCSEDHY